MMRGKETMQASDRQFAGAGAEKQTWSSLGFQLHRKSEQLIVVGVRGSA
jgi:hypothetical protein